MSKPVVLDLFCGLGGWTEGFLEEGWDVVGVDITRHAYGEKTYPAEAQLILADILRLHGRDFAWADAIVASPPCQTYSWMAQPWSLAKALAEKYRAGIEKVDELNALFNACFRIQREAIDEAGRYIPMIVENVKGAQPWVGKAQAHYGSYYLWGDIHTINGNIMVDGWRLEFGHPDFLPPTPKSGKGKGGSWFPISHGIDSNGVAGPGNPVRGPGIDGIKLPGQNWSKFRENGTSPHWTMLAEDGTKVGGQRQGEEYRLTEGTKQQGSGVAWFDKGIANLPSNSARRKTATAKIAMIPPTLSRFIARSFLHVAEQQEVITGPRV